MSILRVITKATSTRLTTPEAVVARMEAGDPTSPALEQLIDAASNAISNEYDTIFGQETVLETFRRQGALHHGFGWGLPYLGQFNHHQAGGEALILGRRPIVGVTSVVEDGIAQDSGVWEFDPLPGLLYRVSDSGDFVPWCGMVIAVTFSAGWKLPGEENRDLPAAYEEAAILTCVAMLRTAGRDPTLRSVATEGVGSYAYDAGGNAPSVIPPQAQALLNDLRVYRIT